MQSIILYNGKKLKIGDFYIELPKKEKIPDYYMTSNFNAFITNKDDVVADYKLLIGGNTIIGEKKKISEYIYKEDKNYIFDNYYKSDYRLTYRISENFKTWELVNNDVKPHIFDWVYMLGNIFAYSILNKNAIVFHGVIIEYKGMGIIISAKSGIGKTTHARMWRDFKDAIIINGDRALCRKKDDKWYAYGSPWNGSSGECMNRKVPIKAIIMLEQSQVNKVHRLSPFDASLKLIERTFAPSWDSSLMNKALDTIDNIVSEIPILRLECRPDLESVEVLEKALEDI